MKVVIITSVYSKKAPKGIVNCKIFSQEGFVINGRFSPFLRSMLKWNVEKLGFQTNDIPFKEYRIMVGGSKGDGFILCITFDLALTFFLGDIFFVPGL